MARHTTGRYFGFRIDLGIKHPDKAGAYLAGVECDGATYHSSATARDRDKVREQVLRGLGWNIVRVWSTDWWFDRQGAAERMHQALSDLLEESRSAPEPAMIKPVDQTSIVVEIETVIGPVTSIIQEEELNEAEELLTVPAPPRAAETESAVNGDQSLYRLADLSAFNVDPDSFFEFSYRPTLIAMVQAVMNAEAPLR